MVKEFSRLTNIQVLADFDAGIAKYCDKIKDLPNKGKKREDPIVADLRTAYAGTRTERERTCDYFYLIFFMKFFIGEGSFQARMKHLTHL